MTPKQIRGQLRQIIQEMLPEILSGEAGQQMRRENEERLARIEANQRDIMSMIIRMSTPKPAEVKK